MLNVLTRLAGGGTVLAILLGLVAALYHGWSTGRLQDLLEAKTEKLGELTIERDIWKGKAEAAKARAQKLAELQQAADDSVRHLQAVLSEREKTYQAQRQRILDAPADADGPVAPVLRETLEGLP